MSTLKVEQRSPVIPISITFYHFYHSTDDPTPNSTELLQTSGSLQDWLPRSLFIPSGRQAPTTAVCQLVKPFTPNARNASLHSSVCALSDASFSSRESDNFVTPANAGLRAGVSCCYISGNMPGVRAHMISAVRDSVEDITGEDGEDECVLKDAKSVSHLEPPSHVLSEARQQGTEPHATWHSIHYRILTVPVSFQRGSN